MTEPNLPPVGAPIEHPTARSFLGIEDASHGWNSDHGEWWMSQNCARCWKSSKDGSGCLLENWLWMGTVPTDLNGFGIRFDVYEASMTQLDVGGSRTTWHGRWYVHAHVPDECPQREAAKPDPNQVAMFEAKPMRHGPTPRPTSVPDGDHADALSALAAEIPPTDTSERAAAAPLDLPPVGMDLVERGRQFVAHYDPRQTVGHGLVAALTARVAELEQERDQLKASVVELEALRREAACRGVYAPPSYNARRR